MLTPGERATLLRIARAALGHAARGADAPPASIYEEALADPVLGQDRGVFVTLHAHGELRGCIGYVEGHGPLARSVAENAVSAATRDYRFRSVTPAELLDIDIEISVLTPLRDIAGPEDVVVGRDGLVASQGGRRGLLLPQVATEHDLPADRFVEETCRKAGLPRDAWRHGARLQAFSAEVFGEKEREAE
ncbi:MAG: AmmeMemoRadiSam system protein A [Acidobacteriota bacterium]